MTMRVNRVSSALVVATILGGRAILGVTGNAATADQILGFLSPSARAFVMSEATWNGIAIMAFLWLAYELSRDAGLGAKALRDAKASNAKAWAFSAEFEAYRSLVSGLQESFDNLRLSNTALIEIVSGYKDSRTEEILREIGAINAEVASRMNHMHQEILMMTSQSVNSRIRSAISAYANTPEVATLIRALDYELQLLQDTEAKRSR